MTDHQGNPRLAISASPEGEEYSEIADSCDEETDAVDDDYRERTSGEGHVWRHRRHRHAHIVPEVIAVERVVPKVAVSLRKINVGILIV